MRLILIGGLATLFLMQPAAANFFTYAEWLRLSREGRAAYISGAYDSVVTFALGENGRRIAVHYGDCIRKTKMSNDQLAENIRKFVEDKPKLQAGSVQMPLIEYMHELCGDVPNDVPKAN